MLYLLLVVVFSKLSKQWWLFLLIGWGTSECDIHETIAHSVNYPCGMLRVLYMYLAGNNTAYKYSDFSLHRQ